MIKVTLLGAGSGFTQPLFTDILNIEGIDSGIIGLVDIDKKRLDVNVKLMHRILLQMGKSKWKIEASTNRRDILKGTDYLINSIEANGLACVNADSDIPNKYGIGQCIGDTIGPGGVMKALRSVPVWIEILKDAQRFCPNALIMNYTNPMSIMSLAAVRTTSQPYVGLCHSVQGTSKQLARYANVPYNEMAFKCGGINHMSWFTELVWKKKNQDIYPILRAAMNHPEVYKQDNIRFDMMREFGYFVTESSAHFSEYVPYFRKRPDLVKKCHKTGFYAGFWPRLRAEVDKLRLAMANGKKEISTKRSHEYAADIIEGHLCGRTKTIYGSVLNTGLIPNLPQDGVVEVAITVDKNGMSPTYFGNLPQPLAALCRSNMAVYESCVEGILNKDREAIIHAMMLDPLSAAVCSLEEIRKMADELFIAEKKYIPAWCQKSKKKVKQVKYKYNPNHNTEIDAISEIAERVVKEMEKEINKK